MLYQSRTKVPTFVLGLGSRCGEEDYFSGKSLSVQETFETGMFQSSCSEYRNSVWMDSCVLKNR